MKSPKETNHTVIDKKARETARALLHGFFPSDDGFAPEYRQLTRIANLMDTDPASAQQLALDGRERLVGMRRDGMGEDALGELERLIRRYERFAERTEHPLQADECPPRIPAQPKTHDHPAPADGGGAASRHSILEPNEVIGLHAIPTATDNQSLHESVEAEILRDPRNRCIYDPDLQARNGRYTMEEFLRGFLNVPNMIVQRATFQNTPAFLSLYEAPAQRAALQTLFTRQNLKVYLFQEHAPDEIIGDYDTNMRQVELWQHLCQETDIAAVRLSKDDALNRSYTDRLAQTFASGVANLYSSKSMALYFARLLNPQRAEELSDFMLKTLPMLMLEYNLNNDKPIGRDYLYKKLVTLDETNTNESRIDPGKPFSREMKRMLDAIYTNNLPDTLGIHSISPAGTLTRADLMNSFRARQGEGMHVADIREVGETLRQIALQRQLDRRTLLDFSKITLADVVALRETDEWHAYEKALQDMAQRENSFAQSMNYTARVSAAHDALIERLIVRLDAAHRLQQNDVIVERRQASLQMQICGKKLDFIYNADGGLSFRETGTEALEINDGAMNMFFANGDVSQHRPSRVETDLLVHEERITNPAHFIAQVRGEFARYHILSTYDQPAAKLIG